MLYAKKLTNHQTPRYGFNSAAEYALDTDGGKKDRKEMDVTGTPLIMRTQTICQEVQIFIAPATITTPQNSMHLKCAQSVVVDSNIGCTAMVTKMRHSGQTMETLTLVEIMNGEQDIITVTIVQNQMCRRHVANVEAE